MVAFCLALEIFVGLLSILSVSCLITGSKDLGVVLRRKSLPNSVLRVSKLQSAVGKSAGLVSKSR